MAKTEQRSASYPSGHCGSAQISIEEDQRADAEDEEEQVQRQDDLRADSAATPSSPSRN